VPSGGANAANGVVRRANARERTSLEVDRSQRRSLRLGAADCRLPPSPKRTAVTLFAARPVRPKNRIASGIGTATCARVLLPEPAGANGEDGNQTCAVSDRPAGPLHAQHPSFEWKAPFCRREHQPRRAWRRREGRRRPRRPGRPG
jgi:hypothetical protein